MNKEINRQYRDAFLEKVCFDGQDLSGADFSAAKLQGSTFRACILTNADFSQADIRGCDFSEAVLVGAKFDFAEIGTSKKRFLELLLSMPFGTGKPPNEEKIVNEMINEGRRFTIPCSDKVFGPSTDYENIGGMIYASIFCLVWVVFLWSSFYKTSVAHTDVAVIPYIIAGTVSLAVFIFAASTTFNLTRRLSSTSFHNANLSQTSFKGIDSSLVELSR